MLRHSTLRVALLIPGAARGQERPALMATLSGTVGVQRPSYAPLTAPQLFGMGAGAEVRWSSYLVVRGTVNWKRSVSVRDDLSVCLFFTPPDSGPPSCFKPRYAEWYIALAADLLGHHRWTGPFYGIAGGGWTAVSRQTYAWTAREPDSTTLKPRAIVRWGVGATLGRSIRAPRLEVVRTRFAGAIGTARQLTAMGLWLRF